MKLNTKAIALTIVFTALAIVLTPIAIPAGFLLGYFYRFWEIPIVVAFLLLGPKIGVTVAVLRTLAEMTLFPAPILPVIGPLTALGGTLAMLLGIYVAGWLLKRRSSAAQGKSLGIAAVTYFTALGASSRAIAAPIVMYPVYHFFLPHPFSDAQILALAPPLMVFAFTLVLYTVPIGYVIARTVSRNLGVGNIL